MTLTIELPDETADRVRAAAHAQGQDLNTFATALLIHAAADNDYNADNAPQDPDPADLAALAAAGIPPPGFAASVRLAREADGDFRTVNQILRDQWERSEPRP